MSTTSGYSQLEQPVSITVSKKMKLVLKHTPQQNESEADNPRIRSEINNYLQYFPGDDEDGPLLFWQTGLFPSPGSSDEELFNVQCFVSAG